MPSRNNDQFKIFQFNIYLVPLENGYLMNTMMFQWMNFHLKSFRNRPFWHVVLTCVSSNYDYIINIIHFFIAIQNAFFHLFLHAILILFSLSPAFQIVGPVPVVGWLVSWWECGRVSNSDDDANSAKPQPDGQLLITDVSIYAITTTFERFLNNDNI